MEIGVKLRPEFEFRIQTFPTLWLCVFAGPVGDLVFSFWQCEIAMATSSLVLKINISNTCKVCSIALALSWCWMLYLLLLFCIYYCCLLSLYRCDLLHQLCKAGSLLLHFICTVHCEASTHHWLVDLFIEQTSNEDCWELISPCK